MSLRGFVSEKGLRNRIFFSVKYFLQKSEVSAGSSDRCNFDTFLYIGLVTISIGLIFVFIGVGEQVID